jgi:uncharacterized protein (TIGR03086 family)
MEPLEALDRARQGLAARLALVGDDQWGLPTPCTEWDVRALVTHVVSSCTLAPMLLRGMDLAEARAAFTPPEGDLRAAFAPAADAQAAAFAEPGALARTVRHPAGEIPGADYLGLRISDMAIHTWDLARAIGADEALDPELVALSYARMAPRAPFLGQSGFFGTGPSGEVGEDHPLQDRLLDLAGRRPSAT